MKYLVLYDPPRSHPLLVRQISLTVAKSARGQNYKVLSKPLASLVEESSGLSLLGISAVIHNKTIHSLSL